MQNILPFKQNKKHTHHIMKKISILDQFAADAINAPAVVTGGGGCKPKTVKCKTKKSKSKKCKSSKSKSHKSSKSKGGGCKPTCW